MPGQCLLGMPCIFSTAMTKIVHFWFSALCLVPLDVLTAGDRGGGNRLSQELCLHRAGPSPTDGLASVPWTGQAGTSVTWERPRYPGHRTGWHSSDTGQAGMWSTRTEGQAEQNKVLALLAATRRVVAPEEPTCLCSQINFSDKAASLHHPGRAGRVPFTAVGKEMAIFSPSTERHCFTLFSCECWESQRWQHGGGGKEGTRSEAHPAEL